MIRHADPFPNWDDKPMSMRTRIALLVVVTVLFFFVTWVINTFPEEPAMSSTPTQPCQEAT